jgi:hypothetical protein
MCHISSTLIHLKQLNHCIISNKFYPSLLQEWYNSLLRSSLLYGRNIFNYSNRTILKHYMQKHTIVDYKKSFHGARKTDKNLYVLTKKTNKATYKLICLHETHGKRKNRITNHKAILYILDSSINFWINPITLVILEMKMKMKHLSFCKLTMSLMS